MCDGRQGNVGAPKNNFQRPVVVCQSDSFDPKLRPQGYVRVSHLSPLSAKQSNIVLVSLQPEVIGSFELSPRKSG